MSQKRRRILKGCHFRFFFWPHWFCYFCYLDIVLMRSFVAVSDFLRCVIIKKYSKDHRILYVPGNIQTTDSILYSRRPNLPTSILWFDTVWFFLMKTHKVTSSLVLSPKFLGTQTRYSTCSWRTLMGQCVIGRWSISRNEWLSPVWLVGGLFAQYCFSRLNLNVTRREWYGFFFYKNKFNL